MKTVCVCANGRLLVGDTVVCVSVCVLWIRVYGGEEVSGYRGGGFQMEYFSPLPRDSVETSLRQALNH